MRLNHNKAIVMTVTFSCTEFMSPVQDIKRRRWNKQEQYSYPRENNLSNMDQNGPSLATTRQLEYIRMLEERNRLRKKMKPKKDVKIERLEREFSTNFNGANSERFTMQKAKQPTRRPKSRTAVRSNAIQAP